MICSVFMAVLTSWRYDEGVVGLLGELPKIGGSAARRAGDRFTGAALVDTEESTSTQCSEPPLRDADSISALTQSFGSGWFSSCTSRPCAAFACAACRAKVRLTAPS